MRIKTWFKKHWKDILLDFVLGICALSFLLAGGVFLWVATLDIPDLSTFEERRVLQSTKIYDRTGEILLYDLHQDVKRTIIPFENISRHIKNATVAIEDDDFYNHIGIDVKAIIRAALSNLSKGNLLGGQGGSTITQQVIKNSLLEQEKRLTRKVKEAILAIKIEQVLTKDEILAYYLNESPYGGTIYGVEEASQAFFGKSSSDVTLAEAAYLAALPQAPTRLSPYGNNKKSLDVRKNLVLKQMLKNKFITEKEYNDAKSEEVVFLPQAVTGIRAPHFVMYVREQLVQKFGEEALAERGLRVITSLDYELQKEAERIVAEKAEFNAKNYDANNAGLVAIDPKTGDILVMVGSKNYFDTEISGNFNIALAERQPGSSIKPFVYASAFKDGYTPETVVFDVKTQFSSSCEPENTSSQPPCYAPENYNHKYKGPIKLKEALPQSLNIPAVKVLYLTGLKDAIKTTSDFGITTLNDPDRLGLTLVLGGGEVRLLEMTGAYGVFANEGVRALPRSILTIEDTRGVIIEKNDVKSDRVIDRYIALQISNILSDNVARAPLWGSNSLVYFKDRDVAAKSGSTNNLRDAWIFGYTPNIAVGAWVGNNNNSPMGGVLSGLITTPMWRAFMDVALKKLPVESFGQAPAVDQSLKPILRGEYIDPTLLINDYLNSTSSATAGLNIIKNNIHSILYFVDKENPRGPYPTNPSKDSQFENWEYGVKKWAEENFGSVNEQQVNVVGLPSVFGEEINNTN